MFADNTLTPREAVRLSALGLVVERARRYGDLAGEVRHFVSRIVGPSIDLLAPSIELLRYEGLIEPIEGEGMEDNALYAPTAAGIKEFKTLMQAPVRPASDLTKLIVALKFRFLHLLDAAERKNQAEMLIDSCETELNRLVDLRGHQAETGHALVSWLDREIDALEHRLAWLEEFEKSL